MVHISLALDQRIIFAIISQWKNMLILSEQRTQFVDQQHQRAALLDDFGRDGNVGRLENEIREPTEVGKRDIG
jgi:hypothetical protein